MKSASHEQLLEKGTLWDILQMKCSDGELHFVLSRMAFFGSTETEVMSLRKAPVLQNLPKRDEIEIIMTGSA